MTTRFKYCPTAIGPDVAKQEVNLMRWSTNQSVIALSSTGAELLALAKACAQGLGMKAVADDLDLDLTVEVHADASAAISTGRRKVLGNLPHVEVRLLWVQHAIVSQMATLKKVCGSKNPADMFTKPLDCDTFERHCRTLGIA